jgi:hypothetical protein
MMGVPAYHPHFLANGTTKIPNRDFSAPLRQRTDEIGICFALAKFEVP